ncbi:family 43 glycosylhydrolase [Clostridium estertheticum]|uniref:Family 43 glycosylhydrolase n=1 Tax=Clostridium estertheticum TaxID=238834 RepID=A0AA47I760_9CLOT|nr:family 43 glycosylhydrolase [Clostridium estertheticum]MBU3155470.1 family 43 glycosylhydrolase [Clostridium estertheticum]WAG60535.1 family 43 glycosylhydrolase [Clostridium estertheticum]
MKCKRFKKLISCVMTMTIMATMLTSPSDVLAAETNNIGTLKEAKARVSVHDPSIVKDGNKYYVFGSHIEAAKSTDLKNWTKFTNSYTTPSNVLFGNLSKNLTGSFAWAGENDGDCLGGHSVWAPFVFKNENYVNSNGTKGAYMMYYCTSSTYKRSAIGYAVSQKIEGPYTYVDTIMYSGFTKKNAHDTNSVIDTKYTNTNIKKLIDNGKLAGTSPNWFTSDGSYNTSNSPNAIDPALFYDTNGKLHMIYGSWSGGIFELDMDDTTGKAIYPDKEGTSLDGNTIDRYFGTKIAGGYTDSGEGPFVVYDNSTGYYYLYVTYAGLSATGGYNIRMFRSKSPDGPYVDAAGNNAALTSQMDNSSVGIKLMGNYKFGCLDVGYRSGGHNSSFIDSDNQMYLIYHTRFDNGTEDHEVRVHQMFKNEDGWPVEAPYEYNGDVISKNGYSMDEMSGTYEFINHGTSNSGASMLNTLSVNLKNNNTITGDVTGTWSSNNGSYYMKMIIGGVTYKGVFFKQNDESKFNSKVITFSAIGSNNQSIWGSKMETDSQTVKYEASRLQDNIPSSAKVDITLPKSGVYDTKISWTSSNPSVVNNKGKINALDGAVDVTLTAQISKGKAVITKEFKIKVKGRINELNVTPIYRYDFNKSSGGTEVLNSGSKTGNSTLVGSSSISKDDQRGKVLQIKNANKAVKTNYLALPSDTFKGMTTDGYTVGMWVNVDTTEPNYLEHSALFEGNAGGQNKFPMTRISANLFGRINSNGTWADATNITTGLIANTWQYVTYTVNSAGIHVYLNGNEVGSSSKDLTKCFKSDFLSNITDVRVGSGDIWGDRDISSAKFDDVSIYNTALTADKVEALYSMESETATSVSILNSLLSLLGINLSFLRPSL